MKTLTKEQAIYFIENNLLDYPQPRTIYHVRPSLSNYYSKGEAIGVPFEWFKENAPHLPLNLFPIYQSPKGTQYAVPDFFSGALKGYNGEPEIYDSLLRWTTLVSQTIKNKENQQSNENTSLNKQVCKEGRHLLALLLLEANLPLFTDITQPEFWKNITEAGMMNTRVAPYHSPNPALKEWMSALSNLIETVEEAKSWEKQVFANAGRCLFTKELQVDIHYFMWEKSFKRLVPAYSLNYISPIVSERLPTAKGKDVVDLLKLLRCTQYPLIKELALHHMSTSNNKGAVALAKKILEENGYFAEDKKVKYILDEKQVVTYTNTMSVNFTALKELVNYDILFCTSLLKIIAASVTTDGNTLTVEVDNSAGNAVYHFISLKENDMLIFKDTLLDYLEFTFSDIHLTEENRKILGKKNGINRREVENDPAIVGQFTQQYKRWLLNEQLHNNLTLTKAVKGQTKI